MKCPSVVTPTLILNLALLIVPPVALVLVFQQWLARHIRWTVALTALCDVFLFWNELFYYECFGLFAVLILVQLATTGAAAFRIYNKQRKNSSSEVLGLIKRTSAEFRQTVVMITHNNDIARLADRIVRIEDGKIVE